MLGLKEDQESWMAVARAGYVAKVSDIQVTGSPVDVLTRYRPVGFVSG